MKRQHLVLLIVGGLITAACIGTGWFLVSAMLAKTAAVEKRNTAYAAVERIYNAKVFPNDETIVRVKEDEKAIDNWLQAASKLVHAGDLAIEPKSPTGFKQSLQATVRELSSLSGSVNGKIVPSGFHFGFDKFLGESDSLPASEHVAILDRQLVIIDRLCHELHAAKVLEIKAVQRETFDVVSQDPAEQRREPTTSRRRRSRDADEATPKKQTVTPESQLFSKQRFSFEFIARPAAFIHALNRLAAVDLFVVVAEVEFKKTSDPFARQETLKRGDTSATDNEPVQKIDPARVPHAQRIVTDPDLDAPVSVKIDVDVYSFEGV